MLKIGTSQGVPFGLTERDLETHLHIMGSTGGGKSWLLMYLASQLMRQPEQPSLFVLDPHGDLYRKLRAHCAQISRRIPSFANRVVVIDPACETYPLRYNPMQSFGNSAFSAALGMEACQKAWQDEAMQVKPRIARWLFNALYVAGELGLSLSDVHTLLDPTRGAEREHTLARLPESFIKDEMRQFHARKPRDLEELTEGPLNRLGKFLADYRLAHTFSQTTNTLEVGTLMARGSIVLVNLEPYRSHFTEEQMRMFGTLLVNNIVQAAFSRPEHKRHPCYLMIDEFSRFSTRDIPYILEGGRKYNLRLILAHQQLEQLMREDERVYASVMANAKAKVVFGDLPMDDARTLAMEYGRFDPYLVKDEIYRTYFHPYEETRVVSGRSEASSTAQSFGKMLSEGAMYQPGGVFFDGDVIATSTGTSSGNHSSSGFSESISEAVVPFYRLEERQELSSRTFMSIDEQQYLAAWALKNQPQQHCAVRTPRGEMKHVRVYDLKEPRASVQEMRRLLKTCFTSHDFFDSVEERVETQPALVAVAEEEFDPYAPI